MALVLQNTPSCEACVTRIMSALSALSEAETSVVTDAKTCHRYSRNESVFSEGEFPRGVYCIHAGHVKLSRLGPDGKEQIVRLAGAGDVVGYASMLSGEPYSMMCTAVEESGICFIPTDTLISIVRRNPQLALEVMQSLSHELEDAENRVVEMAQKSVRERVAEALLVMKETFGLLDDGVTLKSPLSREEIASIVGTAPESVIRTLSEFRSSNLIETEGRTIRLMNLKGLIRTANLAD